MDLIFNWNPTKAEQNVAKHGVKFSEALTAFSDPLARIFDDHDHSGDEHRELLVGRSSSKRLLVVSFLRTRGLDSPHQRSPSNTARDSRL